ncbi:MATE family efflux transporter [Deltaproteobacteria bacterium Smac51]|nr:MATE family efflux transporter [Deltaproteobacteria bacterium Smac51]
MNLLKGPLPKLMRQIAVPAATGMFLQTILNLTDTWFAGRISTEAQAALSLSFPLFFVLNTFAAGLATGASALVGRALGASDSRKARCMAGQAIILALSLSVMLMIIGPLISRPAFISMGAGGEYLEMCLNYMDTVFLFAPAFLMLSITNSLLTVQGDSRGMRNALAAGAVANVGLDYWLMNGGLGVPPLGVTGLALATVSVQVGSLIYLSRRVHRTGLFKNGFWSALKPDLKMQMELWGQAIPPGLNLASVGLGIYVISWFVGQFGAEAVAAYGVATRIEQLTLLPALGIAMAVLPLTAQNDGAGNFKRAEETRALAVSLGARVSVVSFFLLVLGGKFLMGLFTPEEGVKEAGAYFLRFDACVFWAYVFLNINVSFLQGLKRPMFAVWIGLYRQIAAPVLVFWLLAFKLDLGLTGIWLGIVLITASGAVISEIYTRRVINTCRTSNYGFFP